jgi:hypothetical protein
MSREAMEKDDESALPKRGPSILVRLTRRVITEWAAVTGKNLKGGKD